MAFGVNTQWMVINGGSDGNTGFGGGFDPGQTAGMLTDGAATTADTSAPVFTSASYNFVAGDVGARIYIASGTNWIPGFYLIASVAANAATLTATIGTATLYPDLSLSTVTGAATTSSPTGATWSIDYSMVTAAIFTYSDLTIDAATNTDATSVLKPFGKQQVGNIVAISSGTGFTVQRVCLNSIPSGAVGRFDKSLGTLASTLGVGKMGGAFASPGFPGGVHVSGNVVWIKYNSTDFTVTSTSAGATNGRFSYTAGASLGVPTRVIGFDVTPGDETANRPTIKWGVNAASNPLFSLAGQFDSLENVILNCNLANFTSTRGISLPTGPANVRRVKIMNASANAVNHSAANSNSVLTNVEITGCSTATAVAVAGAATMELHGCYIHDNTFDGITNSAAGNLIIVNTILATNKNGAANSGLVVSTAGRLFIDRVTIYNSGSHGIDLQVACSGHICNSYFETNGGYGINVGAVSGMLYLINNGYYNNTTGKYTTANVNMRNVVGEVIPTASALTNPGSGDFSLNNTGSAGAVLRAAAFPATFPGSSTNAYGDIGAGQHQDSGGGTTQIFNIME